MAVMDRVHAEVEEVFDWSTVRWSEKMREKLTVGWEESGREPGGARPAVGCLDWSSTYTRRCMAGDRRGVFWVFVDRWWGRRGGLRSSSVWCLWVHVRIVWEV